MNANRIGSKTLAGLWFILLAFLYFEGKNARADVGNAAGSDASGSVSESDARADSARGSDSSADEESNGQNVHFAGPQLAKNGAGGNVIETQGQSAASPDSSGWSFRDRVYANYYGILYGPSVGDPTSFQPTPQGKRSNIPVYVRNYGTFGYALDNFFALSATAYWIYVPVRGQQLIMRDPYLRLAMNDIISNESWNYYADVRFHAPVSEVSRDADLVAGLQTFHVLTYTVPNSRFTVGTYGSARMNLFGSRGNGNDLEVYLGPNAAYKITPTVSATMLYEMSLSHGYGNEAFIFTNDGTDLQPGISWDITPKLNVNPYLNIYTGDQVSTRSTSVGMTLSWLFL